MEEMEEKTNNGEEWACVIKNKVLGRSQSQGVIKLNLFNDATRISGKKRE
jgi:hypothetical protein